MDDHRPVTDACATGLKATRNSATAPRHPCDSCVSSRPCRQASTRAPWPWQRKCVPTLPWRATTPAALVEAAMARLRTGGYTYTWSLACTASTRR